MRGRRGRPPKTLLMPEPSPGPGRGLRPRRTPKVKARGGADEDFVTPTKRSSQHPSRGRRKVGSVGPRGRGRGRATPGRGRGRRSAASAVVYDDHESEEEEDAVSLASEEDEEVDEEPISDDEEEEAAIDNESDYLEELPEEEEDDASYCTESSHGSTPGTSSVTGLSPSLTSALSFIMHATNTTPTSADVPSHPFLNSLL